MRSRRHAPCSQRLHRQGAKKGTRVINLPVADFLGLLRHLAQFDWLIRRHVNLRVQKPKRKRSAIRGSRNTLAPVALDTSTSSNVAHCVGGIAFLTSETVSASANVYKTQH